MAPNNRTGSFFSFFTIFAFAAVFQLLSATSGDGDGDLFCYEECLRRALALAPAPPPRSNNDGGVISPSVICKDKGRVIMDTVKITGKLPRRYLQALCHVLKDQWKVEAHVKDTFRGQDAKRLLDGRTCETVTAGKPDRCAAAV